MFRQLFLFSMAAFWPAVLSYLFRTSRINCPGITEQNMKEWAFIFAGVSLFFLAAVISTLLFLLLERFVC